VLDPTKRLSGIEAVKAHKAFVGYDWVALEAKTIVPPFIPNCSQVSVMEELKVIDNEYGCSMSWPLVSHGKKGPFIEGWGEGGG
jgi:hypothetical protein